MNLITLLTDFGTRDYFVGALKGAILAVNPDAKLIDISHEIPAHDVRLAAFTLFAAHSTFPAGTIHLAVVDPGVGSARRPVLAVTEKYLFVAPDNGLLSLIYEQEPETRVFQITSDRFFRQPVSATFHGRDVFAPVAGAVSRGVLPSELGEEITDFVKFEINKPHKSDDDSVTAEIIQIDHFGNCVTNIRSDDLPAEFADFSLETGEKKISKLQNFYAEAENSRNLFMIWGSAGFLEISAFQASAAKRLKAKIGETVLLKKQ